MQRIHNHCCIRYNMLIMNAMHFPITSRRMILLRPVTSSMQSNRYAEQYTNKYMRAMQMYFIFYLFMHLIWKPDSKNDIN